MSMNRTEVQGYLADKKIGNSLIGLCQNREVPRSLGIGPLQGSGFRRRRQKNLVRFLARWRGEYLFSGEAFFGVVEKGRGRSPTCPVLHQITQRYPAQQDTNEPWRHRPKRSGEREREGNR